MQSKITLVLALALLTSCTAPKYTYHFSHYRNDVAMKMQAQHEVSFVLNTEELSASAADQPVALAVVSTEPSVNKPIQHLTRSERVHLKKEIKKFVKPQKKTGSVQSAEATKAMDHDLKLAAIFGAVGVVGLALNGIASVFGIIGGIAFLIGVVFFVKWIIRQ